MNNKIARILLKCKSEEELTAQARDITTAHNEAAHYGFIDTPQLIFSSAELTATTACVTVKPHCGVMNIKDIYNLKSLWEADDLNIDIEGIEMCFKK